MAEPSTSAIVTVLGVGIASTLPQIDGNALIGSFAGAALFVMSAKELTSFYRLGYLVISLIAGYLSAQEIMAIIPIKSGVAGFVGGLASVTVSLMGLDKLREANFSSILEAWKK